MDFFMVFLYDFFARFFQIFYNFIFANRWRQIAVVFDVVFCFGNNGVKFGGGYVFGLCRPSGAHISS